MLKSPWNSQIEFIAMMASLMAVVALAIDALLPALDVIGITIGTQQPADNQLIITMIFLGLGIGPLVFGPVSDAKGRKPIVYMGFGIFLLGSIICVFAHSLPIMIVGRILQGVGLSAPRTISIAIIRDLYSGDYMARILSFVTVVFLLVPIVAPAAGKFVLDHYNWKGIFYAQLLCSALVCFWFWKRQPETLAVSKRIPFTRARFAKAFTEVMKERSTIGFTLIQGLVMGAFLVYLSGSQQIFELQYGLKEEFPLIFAGLSIAIGIAIFTNGSLVMRFGMLNMVTVSLYGFLATSALFVALFYGQPNPSITILMVFFSIQFFFIGFLFGNLRALAMEPMGHIAGMAAAITGLISTLMGIPISTFIGRFIDTHVLPVFIGFLICALLSVGLLYVSRKALKQKSASSPQGIIIE
ncbi:MAG: multidrug effflux MFS transporter [Flavobacteriaceae bacterium]